MPLNKQEPNGSAGGDYGLPNEYADEYDALFEEPSEPQDPPPPANNRTRASARGYRPPYEKPSRRPSDEREDSFNTLAWLVEGATGFIEELRHNDLGLSEEFWVHAAAARREGLLAARAVLDQFLEETQEQQTADRERQARQTRRGGINVDF
jgi:hypothetical protein